MAFQNFSFPQVEQALGLTLADADLFSQVPALDVRPEFVAQVLEGANLASAINTEKARSEFVIAPVLFELRRLHAGGFGLFSGVELEADASRDESLIAVRIDKAATVLVSAGRDDTSILIVLTVRHLAPQVPISVVVRADDNEIPARQAGADNVINPVRFTGLLLAGSAQGTHVAEYLADLASVSGRVQLVERPATEAEIGRPLDDLPDGGRGLRIHRGAKAIGFWEDEARRIEAGDVIVEIKPTAP